MPLQVKVQPRYFASLRRSSHRWIIRLVSAVLVVSPTLLSATTITVGPIQWTDRLGTLFGTSHPAQFTPVEFYDFDGLPGESMTDDFLGTALTDAAGNVTFETDHDDPDGTIEFYAYLRAEVAGITRVKKNLSDAQPYRQIHTLENRLFIPEGDPVVITPAETFNVPEGDAMVFGGDAGDIQLINVNFFNRNGPAMVIAQTIGFMGNYYNNTHAANLPFMTTVYNSTLEQSTYSHSLQRINVRYSAWGARDVLMHEYGHHVSHALGFSSLPGGGHAHGLSNIRATEQGPSASHGAELGWGEGIATFLALMAVQDGDLSGAVPGLSPEDYDTNYASYASTGSVTKEEDLTLQYGLEEAVSSRNRTPDGEGDEWAIALALWDFYDSENETYASGPNRQDKVTLGASGMFALLDNNNPTTFRAAWHAITAEAIADPTLAGLSPGANSHEVLGVLGEVLEEYNITGQLLTSGPTNDTTPELSFSEANNDNSGSYAMVLFDEAWNLIDSNLFSNVLEEQGILSWEVGTPLMAGETYWWATLNTSALYGGSEPSLTTDIDQWYWSGLNSITIAAVPEPESHLLLACLLAGVTTATGSRRSE